jgi:hypothetical protein
MESELAERACLLVRPPVEPVVRYSLEYPAGRLRFLFQLLQHAVGK